MRIGSGHMRRLSIQSAGTVCFLGWSLVLGAIVGFAQPCPRSRAMWVYTGSSHPDVIHNADERRTLLDFAQSHGIVEIFLRVPMDCTESGGSASCGVRPGDVDGIQAFLADAQGRGIRVDALRDGTGERPAVPIWASAELALQEHHPKVRALVQAILDFNSTGDVRFDAMHLDIEPYTLSAYRRGTDEDKIEIIRQFLVLNQSVAAMLDGEDLGYGIDIGPGWHGFEPEPNLLMEFDGRKKYPTRHLLDMVKSAVLMVYLNRADRLIAKDGPVIEYANRDDVAAGVYLGVQTCPGRDGTFGDGTRVAMEERLCAVYDAFQLFDSFSGFSYFNSTCYREMVDYPRLRRRAGHFLRRAEMQHSHSGPQIQMPAATFFSGTAG